MNNLLGIFTSSIGRKVLMSLTGLFLVLFLLIHVVGNLQLFRNDDGYAFNTYTILMTSNPLIKTVSYLLYATIVAHAVLALVLTLKNMSARKKGYGQTSGATSKWSARNMGILGTIILVFIVVHMSNFWYEYKFSEVPWAQYLTNLETNETTFTDITDMVKQMPEKPNFKSQEFSAGANKVLIIKNLYHEVKTDFQNELWLVCLYVFSMIALSFHLLHGFQSAFQTLGIRHKTYTPIIKFVGYAFGIIVPILFAAMPLYFYFNK
ncbi:MAG: succinate dehydrogenase cytochrome b subunit [Bacteroidetes bacterium]|nr:succinate dehydrogenase cytochrome b subunit [Bacteroidota bacterium]